MFWGELGFIFQSLNDYLSGYFISVFYQGVESKYSDH